MRIDFATLADPTSPLVTEALKRYCVICKARAGVQCSNRIRPGEALPGRCVHIARATAVDPAEDEG